MPAPLAVDWSFAKLLKFQGCSNAEIAAKLGIKTATVAKRVEREKWGVQNDIARKSVSADVARIVANHSRSIQERAEEWIESEASNIEKTAQVLNDRKIPKSLTGLIDYETLRGLHTKRGRATFGLDNQSSSIQVNIGLVGPGAGAAIDDAFKRDAIDCDTGKSTDKSTG